MKTYDPKQVIVIWGGRQITGFADGTFVKVSRNTESFKLTVGADGEGARAKSNDKSGKVEITLLQTSEGNKILADGNIADEANNSGVKPLKVQDLSGNDLHVAAQSFVEKPTDAEYGKEVGSRTWVLVTDELITRTAGN